jgi:hypothetical protein
MNGNEGLSASDVALLTGNGNNGWGMDGGWGSMIWLFAIIALMGGWGNGGFGGNNGFANAIGYENLATSNEVQRGFDQQNSMANEREILATVNANSLQGMQNANQNTQYMMSMFNDKYNELQRDIAGVAMAQQAAIANQSECCCNTLRAIDGVNYNNAMNTAAINANTTAQTQRILDYLTTSDNQKLRDENMMLRMQGMTQDLVRYPTSTSYNAGFNPFCNCNN